MKLQNKIFAALLAGTILTSAIAGCDDPNSSAVKPTTKPAAVVAANQPAEAPATVAAYPMKPPSVLSIDNRDVPFPAAKLAVIGRGSGGYTLLLCSDDPPTAIDPGYAGNSYQLYMRLPIDRLADLPGCTWDFKPADDDSNDGIFLHGFREQLHPIDVHVLFQKDGDELFISLSGHCLRNDTRNPAAPPQRVTLNAYLHTSEPAE